jgi:hypothetical protein
MPEPDRQEQIAETLSLLSQMTLTALTANRDELFFRAGEASARNERRRSSTTHRVIWPAAAAALALLAAGLGAVLLMREPEVRVVHIERPVRVDEEQASSAIKAATPRNHDERDDIVVPPAARLYAAHEMRHRPGSNGIIHSQDWAALSDAFAGQLRMQQERSHRARDAMLSATVEERGEDMSHGDSPPPRAQSYLELRDAMQRL